jgi:hypothetical protein
MRILGGLILLIFSISVKAQTALPGSYIDHSQRQSFADNNRFNDSVPDKKWFVSKYIGISSGIGFYNGGNTTMLAVPVGIQINRRLNNNWYAFAGASVAPTYINFNHSFLSSNTGKSFQNNAFSAANGLNMFSRAEMGLMYINDQKTFSISGSISVERSSYPLVPINQMSTAKPTTFIAPKN